MRLIKEKGVTIVEIVVAIGLLGIVSTGLIGFFTDSFKFQARSQESSRAQKVAEEIFEELNDTKEYHSGTKTVILSSVGLGYEEEILKNDNYVGRLTVDGVTGGPETGWTYDVTVTVTSQGQNKMIGVVNSTIEIAGTLGDRTELSIVYHLPYGEWIYGNDYTVKYDINRTADINVLGAKPIYNENGVIKFIGWSNDNESFNEYTGIKAYDVRNTQDMEVYGLWYCYCCNGYFYEKTCDCNEEWCKNNCGKCTECCKECYCGITECDFVKCDDCKEMFCPNCDMCSENCGSCEYCCEECSCKIPECEFEWCSDCGDWLCPNCDMCGGDCGYCNRHCNCWDGTCWCLPCEIPVGSLGELCDDCPECDVHPGCCIKHECGSDCSTTQGE